MRKLIALLFVIIASVSQLSAQSEEVQQLLLNVEKLSQLKQILSDLKKGYAIVSEGYNSIKKVSQNNFSLHQAFLNGLFAVSPAVRKYKKVSDIVSCQLSLVREYKNAYNKFKTGGSFDPDELSYLESVYTNLFNQSVRNLDALTIIITSNQLRMSDDERLKAIDNIFDEMQDKLVFLRYFNNSAALLAIQKAREKKDAKALSTIYGINN